MKFTLKNKEIKWGQKQECDFLIFDDEGLEDLKYCIPPEAKYFVFKIRTEIPLISSLIFLISLILALFKHKKLKVAYLVALISYLRPKLTLTYIDNSPYISLIHELFPQMPVVAVQNGMRWDFSKPNNVKMNFDHYFAFGLLEADIFLQGGHSVSNYYSVGSLRAGIFSEKFPAPHRTIYDLCLISQFDPMPKNINTLDQWNLEMYMSYGMIERELYRIILQYANENNLNLVVAMRHSNATEEYEKEHEHFNFFNDKNVSYIPQSRFSSYKAVQQSELIFSISSTLAYEALGWGKRVIFAKDLKPVRDLVFRGSWSDNLATFKLPEYMRLMNIDYSELSLKANKLLSMEDAFYLNYCEDARSYYMTFDMQNRTHEIIKNKLNCMLQSSL
jgi:surface carbohydrate biosynthesis protein